MPRRPTVSGREMIAVLEQLGYEFVRQRGSHVTMVHRALGKVVPVPVHGNKPLPAGTLSAIMRQAGLDNDRLREMLARQQ